MHLFDADPGAPEGTLPTTKPVVGAIVLAGRTDDRDDGEGPGRAVQHGVEDAPQARVPGGSEPCDVLAGRTASVVLRLEERQGLARNHTRGRVTRSAEPAGKRHRRGAESGRQHLCGRRGRNGRYLRQCQQRRSSSRSRCRAQSTAVQYSPAGDAVATAGADGIARIWNTADGSLRCSTLASDGHLTGVVFSPDGASLLTLDTQGDTRIWTAGSCQAVDTARSGRSRRSAPPASRVTVNTS